MAKDWKTVRKNATKPREEDQQAGTETNPTKNSPPSTSKLPRRLQMARARALDPSLEPDPETAPAVAKPTPVVETSEPIEPTIHPLDVAEPRILLVQNDTATHRLIEETFNHFTHARTDSTSDLLAAFELAITRDYQLFIIGLQLPDMTGPFFYEMISRAYKTGLGNRKLAPAVVYIREANETVPGNDLLHDVRVKAFWSKPLNMERMLESVAGVIKRTP